MKKFLAFAVILFSVLSLAACHDQYYNDGSDYAAPGFQQGKTDSLSVYPKSLDELSDFERGFIEDIFGDGYSFCGYDSMTDADKDKIRAYFKQYNEGYYSVGFENGFFYTYNEIEGKETYSIPWGYETLSDKIPEPDFGERTKTSFSESLGFTAEYKNVDRDRVLEYCEKMEEFGFALDYEEKTSEFDSNENTVNRIYKDADVYEVNMIFSDGVFRLNITSVPTVDKENSK